jgi:hypothetical protein
MRCSRIIVLVRRRSLSYPFDGEAFFPQIDADGRRFLFGGLVCVVVKMLLCVMRLFAAKEFLPPRSARGAS